MTAKSDSFRFAYLGLDRASLKFSVQERLLYSVGKHSANATARDWYHTAAFAVRDRLVERWLETLRSYERSNAKRIYYLSLEFLIGRTLQNSLSNMNVHEELRGALQELGADLEAIEDMEPDAALGNGGLGRLAACFMDSMATMRLPGFGYGIRYEYGMFRQRIEHGQQVEHPDNWLRYGNPWEFPRPEVLYPVKFYGRVTGYHDKDGHLQHDWHDTEEVMAMAYDTLIPGYNTNTVNHMRLWSAKASRDFNLEYFNRGDYIKAVEEKNESENISRVLYPSDVTTVGRELRLQQEYFFVSAALQDIVADFRARNEPFERFPDRVAIQLNDTHPAIAIPELMRLLVDEHGLDWPQAWDITIHTFSYTNHTLMPEALETWPVELIERMLPRHLQIIYEINHRFLGEVRSRYPDRPRLQRQMSLIDEEGERRVRMAHLAIVGGHRVNGVSGIHTELMKDTIFRDFHGLYPERIVSITNGITPRRWLKQVNPRLAEAISARIGRGWTTTLEQLRELAPLADDRELQGQFREIKQANKKRLARLVEERLGVELDPSSLFDVQVKRIHEYKRQLLNLLHVITLYHRMRAGAHDAVAPRTVVFSGKAAPGYALAKLIIKAINDVARVVNSDPQIGGRLRVVFIPNYDVTTAGDIVPAAELSQQISLAGTEASGTGNMKLALNGALTIGTLDGANIEIREEVGEDNIFIFGLGAEQAARVEAGGYRPRDYLARDQELRTVLEMLEGGHFSPGQPDRFRPLVQRLTGDDPYLTLADYRAYVDCQQSIEDLYSRPSEWTRRAILNVAGMGRFSSDRAVREYAERIWKVRPVAHA